MPKDLIVVPPSFRATALAMPDKIKAALAQVDDPAEAQSLLDKTEAMSVYARRIHADTETVNAIQYGRLLVIAKLAEWMPGPKAGPGRGKRGKKTGSVGEPVFAKATRATYRLIGAHAERIDEYRDGVECENQVLPPDDPGLTEISIAGFRRYIMRSRRQQAIDKLDSIAVREVKAAQGIYDMLVIDPPWPIEKIERDVRPNQVAMDYPTMSLDELAALALPMADECHVWLWTTHRFLPAAFSLLDSWGLKYVCTFVWKKAGGFQPVGLPQYNCEFALYGRRGSPAFSETKALKVCFDAPRGKHSEKPEAFYEMVRRVTAGRRLDMFNRRKIEGFDSWGKEAG